ncbi:Protein prenyltransferase [Spraguea lophii 42_110]|uniref:Protein prenyltransferase n=1 Tax=Spraguea lophii (strain 42_110) TaxID=1358809 RepID=S7W7T7_SPRLO|nr:Protein prenyltransferase [Spraguea lophii 42_110]
MDKDSKEIHKEIKQISILKEKISNGDIYALEQYFNIIPDDIRYWNMLKINMIELIMNYKNDNKENSNMSDDKEDSNNDTLKKSLNNNNTNNIIENNTIDREYILSFINSHSFSDAFISFKNTKDSINEYSIRMNISDIVEFINHNLSLTYKILKYNIKSYQVWNHRRYIMDMFKLYDKSITNILLLENRNFHCWNYIRNTCRYGGNELEEISKIMLKSDTMNYSAIWNIKNLDVRSFLFTDSANEAWWLHCSDGMYVRKYVEGYSEKMIVVLDKIIDDVLIECCMVYKKKLNCYSRVVVVKKEICSCKSIKVNGVILVSDGKKVYDGLEKLDGRNKYLLMEMLNDGVDVRDELLEVDPIRKRYYDNETCGFIMFK